MVIFELECIGDTLRNVIHSQSKVPGKRNWSLQTRCTPLEIARERASLAARRFKTLANALALVRERRDLDFFVSRLAQPPYFAVLCRDKSSHDALTPLGDRQIV